MTTFDFKQVREFADGLNDKLDRCDNGEGNECATIENALRLYAACCCDFQMKLRQWARDVFAGRVAFDSTTEQTWRAELGRLYDRALKLTELVAQIEVKCYRLDEQCALESAIWNLGRLRDNWVTPKLAVSPSARQQISPTADTCLRIASLPALPKDWEPSNADQRSLFRRIRSERSRARNA